MSDYSSPLIQVGSKVHVTYLNNKAEPYDAIVVEIGLDLNDARHPIWIKLDTMDLGGCDDYWLDPRYVDVDQVIQLSYAEGDFL